MYLHGPTALKLAARLGRGGWRRVAWSAALLPLFTALWATAAGTRAADHVLYPRFRSTRLQPAIFLLAAPRSGTTYLHRLLSMDEERFTAFKLYQTLMPSVVAYRAAQALQRIDATLGSPLGRMVGALEKAAFGGWEDIHRTRFGEAEEDEGLWLLMLSGPGVFNLFHEIDELPEAAWADRSAEPARTRMMRCYRESVRRHMFAEGPHRVFLAKNVLATGRIDIIERAIPDSRMVHLVRHPYQSIPSMLSMFAAPWSTFMPWMERKDLAYRRLAHLLMDYMVEMSARAQARPDRVLTVRYPDLIQQPLHTVEQVYAFADCPFPDQVRQRLQAETQRQRTYRSTHRYSLEEFGLTPHEVWDRVGHVMQPHGFGPEGDST